MALAVAVAVVPVPAGSAGFVLPGVTGPGPSGGGSPFSATFTPALLGAPASVSLGVGVPVPPGQSFPNPLSHLDVTLPPGTQLSTAGAARCSASQLPGYGSPRCPAGSVVATGGATLEATLGGEELREAVRLTVFLAASGTASPSLFVYMQGEAPILVTEVWTGSYTSLGVGGGRLALYIPPIPTVPGGPYASITSLGLTTAAQMAPSRPLITEPATCPRGGFPWSATLTFNDATATTLTTRSACPTASYVPPAGPGQAVLPGTGGAITAPPNTSCVSRRHFTIHVRRLPGLTYREVAVAVNGRRVSVVRGSHISAPVDLRGLRKGRYVVRITVTTTAGRRLTGTRAYHTCAARQLPGRHHRL
jgi:hypothetical protein